jgi:hypothetical protein
MNIYDLTVPQLTKTLRNLDSWLATASAYADKKKFPVDTLVTARLAPDQFGLAQQVQSACDNAKIVAGRLSAKEWPKHADTETTIEQLRARIATVITHLESYKPDDFKDAAERKISLPWMEGTWMRGDEYLIQFALPNFYFHVTTAYAILRHNGVELGKSNYIGGLPKRT